MAIFSGYTLGIECSTLSAMRYGVDLLSSRDRQVCFDFQLLLHLSMESDYFNFFSGQFSSMFCGSLSFPFIIVLICHLIDHCIFDLAVAAGNCF